MNCGEQKKAFRACLKGIEYAGYVPNVIHDWANKMLKSGLIAESHELFRLALCQASNDPEICVGLGEVLGNMGNSLERNAMMRIADSMTRVKQPVLANHQLETYTTLADFLFRQRRFDEVKRICQLGLKLDPNSKKFNELLRSLPD